MDTETKSSLNTMLDTAYLSLSKAVEAQSTANQNLADMKTALELAKASKIISGAIQGKNETERKASEATVLAAEIDAVKSAEKNQTICALVLHLCEIEAERVRWKIRIEVGADQQ